MTTVSAASSRLSVLTLLLFLLFACSFHASVEALTSSTSRSSDAQQGLQQQPVGNVLILDHLNINHEQGRHDWLKAFYFDFLACSVDPRKAENLQKGKKTLWTNIGSNQFHLPEGTPEAQVLQGKITLAYPNLDGLEDRYSVAQEAMKGSRFAMTHQDDAMIVKDPWGTEFRLVQGHVAERDGRGTQPGGEESEGLAMRDLTLHAPVGCNMAGIGRFYSHVLGAPTLHVSKDCCRVSVGPQQTLTFVAVDGTVTHDDLRKEEDTPPEGKPAFLSNYGPHVSMYVSDLALAYRKADELGVAYVNPRFKRRAYTLEEALEDCMFRCIDIVDPENVNAGPIIKLEHEIRSVVKSDGSKYKSCPFFDIPDSCVKN